MIKYSVILPIYKDRKKQFNLSLKAYAEQTFPKDKFELIIIDQGNDENIQELFFKYGLTIQYIKVNLDKVGYKGCQNPSYAQNVGFKHAQGNYIVLTSPEVAFENLAFDKIDKMVNHGLMLYCSVGETQYLDPNRLYTKDYLISQRSGMWLCHPKSRHLPMAYFMAILPKQVILDINGVDETYMNAIGYEDDDFGKRLHMKLKPVYTDEIIGAHISHSRSYQQGSGATKVKYGCDIFHKKKKINPFPIMANEDIIWGDNKGITKIEYYEKCKKINNNDLITVFTSCYNQSKYLKESIESVLNQTHQNFEYLIYDDGSTDNTWDIINEFNDKRIIAKKLTKQPNVGVVINQSINESKSKFWSWCPADDIWEPNLLEIKYNKSKQYNHEAIIWNDWNLINEQGQFIGEVIENLPLPEMIWKEVWRRSPVGFTGIWIPKSIFNKVGNFPEHLQKSEDYYWLIKATINKIPFYKCNEKLYRKRNHNNRLSVRYAKDLLKGAEDIRNDLRKQFNFNEYM